MFAHCCEITESDQDLTCLSIILKLQSLIRILMFVHYCEVTESDQDLRRLATIVKL